MPLSISTIEDLNPLIGRLDVLDAAVADLRAADVALANAVASSLDHRLGELAARLAKLEQSPPLPPDPPVPDDPGDDDQDTDTDPTEPITKRVLTRSDFEHLGVFRMPQMACGWSMGFADSGIAFRNLNGQRRMFAASHRYGGDPIFEIEIPGSLGLVTDIGNTPVARVVKEYGFDFYRAKKATKETSDPNVSCLHGLRYDPVLLRLYFNFGLWYNIPPTNDASLSYIQFDENNNVIDVVGEFVDPTERAHNQKMRGGSHTIPQWFSDQYLGGRNTGLGNGGYYSGFAKCSCGHFVAACDQPEKGQYDLQRVIPLIDHPPEQWQRRDGDYSTDIPWLRNPVDGVGFWTALDEALGGSVWIDLPDVHGLLMLSTMGHGTQSYIEGDIYTDSVKAHAFIYDPAALAEVATGKRQPWDHNPETWIESSISASDKKSKFHIPGAAFDAENRLVYVIQTNAYWDGVEMHPLVHVWKIR